MSLGEPPEVLLVEDDPDHADLLQAVVEDAIPRCRVTWIDHGTAAVDHLTRCGELGEAPDLVLLDLNLPGFTGIEVLQRARALPGLVGLPVVVLTSSGAPEDRQAAADAGADRYLVKVAGLDLMTQLVRQVAGELLA